MWGPEEGFEAADWASEEKVSGLVVVGHLILAANGKIN
jgi:hypothetical protein